MALQKVPPPPSVTGDQKLNRWLIALQSILNSGGLIEPENVDGLPAVITQVGVNTGHILLNTTHITANTAAIAANTAAITANTAAIAANAANIATNTANIATLFTDVTANTAAIATNTANIATNTTAIAANTTAITALQVRNQILNGSGVPASGLGNNGDLYLNNTGGAGTRLYGKIGGAWVAIA